MRATASRVAVLAWLTLLVGCDHVTKVAAKAELEGQHPRDLVRGVLDLQYAENRDVAFNLLRWMQVGIRTPVLVVGGAFAVLGLALVLLRLPQDDIVSKRVALLLITAGALGNYLDRVARGYVIDFVHLHHWPVFNVADAYVLVGAVLLGVVTMSVRRNGREPVVKF
jgi:signal peptidase II